MKRPDAVVGSTAPDLTPSRWMGAMARATRKITRKRVSKKPKFSGALGRPLETRHWPALCDAERFKSWHDAEYFRLLAARLDKVPLLMEHYGLPEVEAGRRFTVERLLILVLRLAEDLPVPGFKLDLDHRGKGRPSAAERRFFLWTEVELKKAICPELSDQQACELILQERNADCVPDLQYQGRKLAIELSRARRELKDDLAAAAMKRLYANLRRQRAN